MRLSTRLALACSVAALAAPMSAFAKTVLIIDNNNPVMGNPVVSDHSLVLGGHQAAAGNTVTYSGLVLPTLTNFDQIWDIRTNVAISDPLQADYLSFLQTGGNLLLIGENFISKARNDSILDQLTLVGAGKVHMGDIGDFDETIIAPFDGPFALSSIIFHGAGGFYEFGHGKPISEPKNMNIQAGPLSVGLAFEPGTLDNAPLGRLVVFMDSGLFNPEDSPFGGSVGAGYLTRNIIHYLGDEPTPPPGTRDGVPEPSAWAMMLVGFGAIGAALRRRRVVTA